MANGQWQMADLRGHKRFKQAAQALMDSVTDEHRFLGPGSGLASLGYWALSDERVVAREKRRGEQFLSVFIWVHL
jgi:hypothetical protein